MRARAPWLCFPFLVVALLAPSPAAAASPLDIPAAVPAKFRALVRARLHSPKPRKSSWEPRFQLQTRRGYDLEVIGVDDIVGILVTRHQGTKPSSRRRSRRGTAVTAYVARGTVTSRRIEASFGKFGEVAVRFRPSPRPRKSTPRRRCKGRERFANRSGVFVGSVRFTGEHRYLAVRAHRVKGGIRTPLGRRCAPSRPRVPSRRYSRPVGGGADPFFQASFLQAGWREALASRELLTLQIGKRTLVLAVTEESMGSMARVRYAFSISSSRAFQQNDELTAATLRPPPPFAGTGSYAAAADGTTTWTGRLSAAFPGARHLPLAGPQFQVELESGY